MAISQNASTFEDVVTVIASMVVTAMVAAFIFGLFTFCLVLGGDRVGCDPGKVYFKSERCSAKCSLVIIDRIVFYSFISSFIVFS